MFIKTLANRVKCEKPNVLRYPFRVKAREMKNENEKVNFILYLQKKTYKKNLQNYD